MADQKKMREIRLDLGYQAHPEQVPFHNSKTRFRTIVAGTRGGKSVAGSYEAVRHWLEMPKSHGWVIGPTYPMLRVAEREFWKHLENANEVIAARNRAEKTAQSVAGSTVEFRSAEWPDSLRGPGLDWIWVDEAAYIKKEAHQILRTRVTDTGGRIWYTTTPKGKNEIFQIYMRGVQGKKGYESFRFPTSANPHIPPEEIESARADLPEDFFRQEYLAEFMDDQASVFKRIMEAVATMEARAVNAVMGLDLAKHQDFTVMVVLNEAGHMVDFERFQKLDWPIQKEKIIEKAKTWQCKIIIDSTGVGDPIYDDLRYAGLDVDGVVLTPSAKKMLIQALQLAFEQSELRILDEPVLIEELKMYEYVRTKAGSLGYSAPPGFHDDCVTALALANWGRKRGGFGVRPVCVDRYPSQEATRRWDWRKSRQSILGN